MVIVKNSCVLFFSKCARCETPGTKSRMPAIDRPDNLHLLSRGRVYAPHRRFIINTPSQLPFRCTKIIISIPWFWPGFSKQPEQVSKNLDVGEIGANARDSPCNKSFVLYGCSVSRDAIYDVPFTFDIKNTCQSIDILVSDGDMIGNLNMYYWIFFSWTN